MCGIAGFCGGDLPSEEAVPLLRRMSAAISHRGPDGEGIHVGRGVGLAHRRLSVIDLSLGAAQPMSNADETVWISYNGEIFNYLELGQVLRSRGRRMRTSSDTEVLLHLYEEFGPDFVSELNGDFALAIWDGRRRRMLLARDRMGVRPLFYAQRRGGFYFASEVKALLCIPGLNPELDPVALDQIFTLWAPIAPRTAFKGIFELAPAQMMLIEDGACRTRSYWHLDFPDQNEDDGRCEKQISEDLRALLDDSVRIRLRADVPVGSFLSGGLDSSVVSALGARKAAGEFHTFSVTFADSEYDESAEQQTVARTVGTIHRSISCDSDDIAGAFPSVVRHAEQPLLRTAPAPLYLLGKFVRENGLKVVLSGEGADEIFAGYDLFKEASIRRFCARQPASRVRPRLFGKLYPYLPALQGQTPEYLATFFGIAADEGDLIASHRPRIRATAGAKLFFSGDLRQALSGYDAAEELACALPENAKRWHPLHLAQYIETRFLLPGYILSSQGDRMAMAHGLETRFPFLDHRLVEFAAGVPARMKLRGLLEKRILRAATAHLLPEAIARRSKQPYRAPASAAFRCPAGAYVEDVLQAEAVASAGFFNPQAVGKLLEKFRRNSVNGFRDNSALVGIVSAQLWAREFMGGDRKDPVGRPHNNLPNERTIHV